MNIGQKIRELRKKRGITQEQLADCIGVSAQAVSKWENNIALPDIALTPMIASYFGVSMDELFDYNSELIRQEILSIAKESAKYREHDSEKGRRIIEAGLNKYPENDILLENLLYLINYSDSPDETIATALKIIDITADNSIRYDALRFLAYAYKAKGDIAGARSALEQIPELYFTRLSEMAYILDGDEKLSAAGKQTSVSLEILIEMQSRIAECFTDKGEYSEAIKRYERALALLDLFEASGPYWESYISFFKDRITELKQK